MLTFTDGGLVLIPGFLVPIAALPIAVWILRRAGGSARGRSWRCWPSST